MSLKVACQLAGIKAVHFGHSLYIPDSPKARDLVTEAGQTIHSFFLNGIQLLDVPYCQDPIAQRVRPTKQRMSKKQFIKVQASQLKRGNSIKLPDDRVVVLIQDAKPGTFAGMVILKWGNSPQQYCHRCQNESVEALG